MAELRGTIDALEEALGALDACDVIQSEVPVPVPPSTQDRAFLNTCAASAVSAHSVIRVRAGLKVSMEEGPDTLALRFDDRCLELPRWLSPAISSLLDGSSKAVTAADLPLESADATVLIRRLVAEGLMEPCAASESGQR
jgi:hypothetical protein